MASLLHANSLGSLYGTQYATEHPVSDVLLRWGVVAVEVQQIHEI